MLSSTNGMILFSQDKQDQRERGKNGRTFCEEIKKVIWCRVENKGEEYRIAASTHTLLMTMEHDSISRLNSSGEFFNQVWGEREEFEYINMK